jgi:hypothetical protein
MCWKAQTRRTGRDSDNYRSENRCLGRCKTVGNGFLLALVSAGRIEAWTDPISCKVANFLQVARLILGSGERNG